MADPLFLLRPAKAEDLNFIINSWLKRFRDAISARLVTDRVYYAIQHEVISKIIQKPELNAIVAHSIDDPDHIYGYIVSEDLSKLVPDLILLHWCYVKGPFRRFGIGKALVNAAIGDHKLVHFTHKTHLVQHLNPEKSWTYNPVYIFTLL